MPKINAKRRNFKKRRGTNKRKNKNALVLRSYTKRGPKGFLSNYTDINPFPPSLYTKFVYTGQFEISSGAGVNTSGSQYVWKLNDVYDPYDGTTPTALNTSCYNYTKLVASSGPYSRYKPNACLIDILIFDSDGTNSDSNQLCMLITTPGDTTNVSGVLPDDVEKVPMGKVIRLADSGSQRRRIKQYVPLSSVFGWTKEQYRADKNNTTAPYNGGPASIPRLKLAMANARSAATATTMMVRVKITYFCELYERISDEW